jgi:hypothetical protein
MFRHPICDFVLSITTSNVVWWNKNVETIIQEVTCKEISMLLLVWYNKSPHSRNLSHLAQELRTTKASLFGWSVPIIPPLEFEVLFSLCLNLKPPTSEN